MQVPFKLCEGNINLSHTKPCLKKPRHLGIRIFFLTGKAAFKLALSRYPDEAVQGRCVSEFHRVPKKACRSIAETHRLLGRVKKLL